VLLLWDVHLLKGFNVLETGFQIVVNEADKASIGIENVNIIVFVYWLIRGVLHRHEKFILLL